MDTSKSVFQLHGVDENEEPVLRKKLRRHQVLEFFAKLPPTVIGMEACGASFHWARELKALGHEVVLIPPQYVKAYVDRGKNDAADAAAICEAMSRPKIKKRFVPIKTPDQQAVQMLIGAREAVQRRCTQVSNAIRGYAAEFGVVVPKGLAQIEPLLERLGKAEDIPALAKEIFVMLAGQYRHASAQLVEIEAKMRAFHRANELCRRLVEVPVIGPVTATAMVAKVTAPKMFGAGRNFSAWIGLTPKDHSTAGRLKLGVITRAGDEMLRSLLVCGATAVIRQVKLQIKAGKTADISPWLLDLVRRKPEKLAAVALANKTARIAWKLMVSGERYDARKATALQQGSPASKALAA
jgi:transposase